MRQQPFPRLRWFGVVLIAALSGCVLDADLGGSRELAAAADASDGALDAGRDDATACGPSDAESCAPRDEAGISLLLTVTPGHGTSYFANGKILPAGEYTLIYGDGCWRSGVVSWTVNLGDEGYWLVGGQPMERVIKAPGTVGTFMTLGAFSSYDECVQANRGRPGVSFRFQGGPLGLNLESLDLVRLTIMLEGGESVGGRSPTFQLSCAADSCK